MIYGVYSVWRRPKYRLSLKVCVCAYVCVCHFTVYFWFGCHLVKSTLQTKVSKRGMGCSCMGREMLRGADVVGAKLDCKLLDESEKKY